MQIDLAFIVNTAKDGQAADQALRIEDTDIISFAWAIKSNQYTEEVHEYEAGMATYYRGANMTANMTATAGDSEDSGLPSRPWTVTQTLTKEMLVNSTNIRPEQVFPPQKDAVVKRMQLGDSDRSPDLYW